MKDGEKTKEDLIRELARLRRRVAELETMQKDPDGVNEPSAVDFERIVHFSHACLSLMAL